MNAFPIYTKEEQEILKKAEQVQARRKQQCEGIEKEWNADCCSVQQSISIREQFMEQLRARIERQGSQLKEMQDMERHMQCVFFPDEAYRDLLRMYNLQVFTQVR